MITENNNSKEKNQVKIQVIKPLLPKKKIPLLVGKVIQAKKESKKYLKIVSKKSAVHPILTQKKMSVNMEPKK